MNTNIHVNVNEIPPEVAERIGCVFLGFHKRFQQSPELMAELEAYRAARHPNHKGSESFATPRTIPILARHSSQATPRRRVSPKSMMHRWS